MVSFVLLIICSAQQNMLEQDEVPHRMNSVIQRNILKKALRLFDWMVEASPEGVGVRETAQALGMAASTVHRTLALLEQEGFVQGDPAIGRYRLGLEFHRLAHRAVARFPVTVVAMPIMRRLMGHCKESVFLSLYDTSRQEMIFAASVESQNPLRYVVELNRWVPVYAGGSGLAILAFVPERERRQIYDRTGLTPLTERTLTDPQGMEGELEKIRRRGYALTFGQRNAGAVGMGAPIRESNGQVIGALVVSLPEQRFDPSAESWLAKLLIEHAGRITEQLG
jgi:DNA-binding IclR family transcriptional regulator